MKKRILLAAALVASAAVSAQSVRVTQIDTAALLVRGQIDAYVSLGDRERSISRFVDQTAFSASERQADVTRQLEILDVTAHRGNPSTWVVNFKGFVGDRKNNTGEDRGYVIKTDKDLWKRYSLNKEGRSYQIVVTHKDRILGKLFIDLEP